MEKVYVIWIENKAKETIYFFESNSDKFEVSESNMKKAKEIRSSHPELKGARITSRRFTRKHMKEVIYRAHNKVWS